MVVTWIKSKKPSKRKPGQPAQLTTEQVLEALALMMTKSPGRPTVKGLAKQLGVFPTTIKSRFKGGIEEVVMRLVHHRLEQSIPTVQHGEESEAYLHRLLVAAADAFASERHLSRHVGHALASDLTRSSRLLDVMIGALRAMGTDSLTTVVALQLALSAIIGRVTLKAASPQGLPDVISQPADPVDAKSYPHIYTASQALKGKTTEVIQHEQTLVWGHVIVKAIKAQLTDSSTTSS